MRYRNFFYQIKENFPIYLLQKTFIQIVFLFILGAMGFYGVNLIRNVPEATAINFAAFSEFSDDEPVEERDDGELSDKININTASKDILMQLPNIGEKKAEDIIQRRADQSFETIEEIMDVKGIGEKTFEKLADLITV